MSETHEQRLTDGQRRELEVLADGEWHPARWLTQRNPPADSVSGWLGDELVRHGWAEIADSSDIYRITAAGRDELDRSYPDGRNAPSGTQLSDAKSAHDPS